MSRGSVGGETALLVVTADEEYAARAAATLPARGRLAVSVAESGADALGSLRSGSGIDCVLCDHDLPDVDGTTLLEVVRAQFPDLPFVLLAGAEDRTDRRAAAAGVTEQFTGDRHRTDWDDIAAVAEAAAAYYRRRTVTADTARRAARIDAVRDAVSVVADGRVVHVNEAAVDLFDDSPAATLGRPASGTVHRDGEPIGDAWFEAVASGATPFRRADAHVERADGTRLPVTLTAATVDWCEGTAAAVVYRTRSERPELQRFERAVEAAGHAIYVTDTDGTIEYVNPAFEETTGYSAEEAVGRTPSILRSGRLDDAYYEALWETITAGEVWEEEVVDQRKSGEIYHAHQTIAPILDGDEIEGHVAIQTDVTERKEHERRLANYEQAIEGSRDLIAAIDTDYTYLFANERYREYHDVPADEPATLDTVLEEAEWEAARPRVERALNGEQVQYTTKRSRPGEAPRTFDVRYYPLPDRETREIAGAVATIHDVTERETRERQLLVLSRILRHNLHNDMNVILGHAETLASEADGDVRDRAERIAATGRSLLELTDKQRSVVELLSDDRATEPLSTARAVRATVERRGRQHDGARVEVDVPDATVSALPQLSEAVGELVDNAVEHSDRETPHVRVTADLHPDRVILHVADDGPGIPPHERTILTDGDEIDQLYHGSGMGLWLVHWIVSHSEGQLRFAENEPRGSRVSLSLARAEEGAAD